MEPLSVQALGQQLVPYRMHMLGFTVALPFVTLILGLVLRKLSRKLAGAAVSLAVFTAVIPGVMVGMALAYLFFFTQTNMVTQVDVVLYFAPVGSMLATLLAATRVLPAREIPGMSRIGGMFLMGGILFFLAFMISRTSFVAWLHLGERAFLYTGAAIVIAMLGAWWMMFGSDDDEDRPSRKY
jgi:hypothetical protein